MTTTSETSLEMTRATRTSSVFRTAREPRSMGGLAASLPKVADILSGRGGATGGAGCWSNSGCRLVWRFRLAPARAEGRSRGRGRCSAFAIRDSRRTAGAAAISLYQGALHVAGAARRLADARGLLRTGGAAD